MEYCSIYHKLFSNSHLKKSLLFFDDVFIDVRVGQPVNHMSLQQ